MPVAIHYDIDGIDEVEHKLLGMGARAIETRPLLEAFADHLRTHMETTFREEGPGWAPLKASTIENKGHSTIGRETDAMMNSLTEQGAEGHVEEIFGDELIFGTALTDEDGFPYPVVFNDGRRDGSQVPRPLFNIGHDDLAGFTKVVQAYIVGVDRSLFGLNAGGDMIAGSDRMPSFA